MVRYRRTALAAFLFAFSGAALIFGLDWGRIYWDEHRSGAAAAGTLLIGAALTILLAISTEPLRLPLPSRRAWWALCAVTIGACLAIALGALGGYLHSGDEYAYLFEAETLRAGRLWNLPPPLGLAETASYIWVANGKWVAQYPPGWPALLALFGADAWTGRLANAALTLLAALGIAELVRPRAGRRAAWAAALLFALSPFALFNGGSLYSHTMAAALAIAAMLSSREARMRRSLGFALLAGAAIGLLGITRSVAAVVVLMAVVADQLCRSGWLARGIAIGVGGAPFAALLLAYQDKITGDPMKPVYWLGGRDVDHLYFDLPSILLGTRHAALYVAELSLYVAPLVVPLWLIATVALIRRRRFEAADLVFPLGVLIFLFYPLHPGARFGPRYWFDFWPLAIATIGSAFPVVTADWRGWYRQIVSLSVIYGAVLTPLLAIEWHRVTIDRFDVYRLAASSGLHDATLCMSTPSGTLMTMGDSGYARNGIRRDGPVLFVNCNAASPAMIRHAYPTRSLWYYVRDPVQRHGRLVRSTNG